MVTMKNDESGQGLRKYQILDFVTDVSIRPTHSKGILNVWQLKLLFSRNEEERK